MRGNSFGELLTLTTFGESHGVALGAVIDGAPAGLLISVEDFEHALSRRRPGQSTITTARGEPDSPEILSGIFEGKTLGTPICVIVRNQDARSQDYDPNYLRTGHADRVWEEKYGHRDHRGGGRASGRETLTRVIGGVIAEAILPATVKIVAFTKQIGMLEALEIPPDLTREVVDRHPTRCPDPEIARQIEDDLLECKRLGDSRGGIVEIRVDGLPMGLGEPVFRKAKALLPGALMSVGAVVGVTLGDAVEDAARPGSEFHSEEKRVAEGISSSANGLQGGMTNGQQLRLLVYFKPASTVGSMAREGRHDPCIVPRAVPVLEAMTALVLADLFLASSLDRSNSHAKP